MRLQDYPEVAVEGAPGFVNHLGWLVATFPTSEGRTKAVVLAEWDGKMDVHVFDMTYIKEI